MCWSSQLQNTNRQKRISLQGIQEKQALETPHTVKKKYTAVLNSLSNKNEKEDWEKCARSLNCKTPINQGRNKVKQLKCKDKKRKQP